MASTTTEEKLMKLNPTATDANNYINTDTTASKPAPPSSTEAGQEIEREKKLERRHSEKESAESSKVERPVVDASYVGWKQVGGWEERDRLTEDDLQWELDRETSLSHVLPAVAFGDWYHSVGIFFVGGLLSFALGYFKFSLAPVFFVMVLTALLYRTSIWKYRGSIRELVQKELTVQKVEDDYESMDWLNNFLDKFWTRIEPNISVMVVDQVNHELAKNPSVPGFIKSLWIDQFTLGVKPPRIDFVRTLQNTDPDVAVMDWGLSFTPRDLNDLDAKQLKNFVNQKVIVKAKIFGLTIPIAVHDIAFKVHARVRMKMMTAFPHIETVNIQLMDVPDVDFVLKLFGDSIFNWEIMAIPGLLPFIKEMVRKYGGPMLMPPFSFQLNVPQLLSGSALSIGVLEVNIRDAVDLKFGRSILEEELDTYLEFSFNSRVVGTTKSVSQGSSPNWNEQLFILLDSFTDPLSITLYSRRPKLNDRVLGSIQYNLSSLHEKHVQKNCTGKFLKSSKPVGELNFDLNFHPTLESKKLPDGTIEDMPDLNTGITKIVVEEARDLRGSSKDTSSFVELYINAKLVETTKTVSKDPNPKFDTSHEIVITDRRRTRVKFVVKDAKGAVISTTLQSLNDLIDRTQVDKKWIPLPGSSGELKVTTHWKPVSLDVGSESGAYVPPIGVLRVFLNKAEELRNLEKFGKIDPYARVLVNGVNRGRTNAISSTLDPIWNEAIYIPISSPNQKVTIECMDVETAGKDRTLGKFDVKTSELFQKGADDRYVECIDEEPKFGRLVSNKGAKGTVTYYLSFYPALPILSLEEIHEMDAINENRKKLEEEKAALDPKTATPEQKKKIESAESELNELEDLYSNKMKLDLDELLQYNSGVFTFNLLGGELPQIGSYVQAFFDSMGHPKYSSQKFSTKTIRPGSTAGDCMVKELEWSVTTFRVTKNPSNNRAENCLCEVSIPTIELLKNCYYKPSIVTLTGSATAKVMVQVAWFPILASKLPQADLITNTGDLSLEILNAVRLLPADRNGKSDPYVKFYLDNSDEVIYKTKTQKKTLEPVWNETTTLQLNNRINNYLRIKVMDWDAGNSDDLIGTATVPLAEVDPDSETPMEVQLTGPNGEDGGILYLNFKFSPRYTVSVNKKETKVGDIANKGLSAGLSAGTSVIGGGLGAVGKLKKGILGGGKKKEKDNNKVND
ncbi:AaceriAER411Wp [[Ashbya] aceris (nom. inval.)]|nr:AaceriAER411Wp [[Ashbya] aceris (nom. inval.)]